MLPGRTIQIPSNITYFYLHAKTNLANILHDDYPVLFLFTGPRKAKCIYGFLSKIYWRISTATKNQAVANPYQELALFHWKYTSWTQASPEVYPRWHGWITSRAESVTKSSCLWEVRMHGDAAVLHMDDPFIISSLAHCNILMHSQ